MPYLKISGLVDGVNTEIDITRRIVQGGFSMSENDLDSPNAGRTLDGIMYRGKVTEKNRADIKLVDIKEVDLAPILAILRNEYFTCETDMFTGKGVLVMEMYNSTRKYSVVIIDSDGVAWYQDVSFNIIQR